jgi:hypothetical protein
LSIRPEYALRKHCINFAPAGNGWGFSLRVGDWVLAERQHSLRAACARVFADRHGRPRKSMIDPGCIGGSTLRTE